MGGMLGILVTVVIWGSPIVGPLGAITGTISLPAGLAIAGSSTWLFLPVQWPSNSDASDTIAKSFGHATEAEPKDQAKEALNASSLVVNASRAPTLTLVPKKITTELGNTTEAVPKDQAKEPLLNASSLMNASTPTLTLVPKKITTELGNTTEAVEREYFRVCIADWDREVSKTTSNILQHTNATTNAVAQPTTPWMPPLQHEKRVLNEGDGTIERDGADGFECTDMGGMVIAFLGIRVMCALESLDIENQALKEKLCTAEKARDAKGKGEEGDEEQAISATEQERKQQQLLADIQKTAKNVRHRAANLTDSLESRVANLTDSLERQGGRLREAERKAEHILNVITADL